MNKQTEQILLGSLCGDGGIYSISHKTSTYKELHSIAQKDYLLMKQKILSTELTISVYTTPSHFFKSPTKNGKVCKANKSITIWSKASSKLNYYRNLFYPNGKKILSFNVLNKLNWLGIAIWFCDDGSYSYQNKRIAIHSNLDDYIGVIQFFESKNFNPKPQFKNNSRGVNILFEVKDSEIITKKIAPYIKNMPKCVHYKIGMDYTKRIYNINRTKKTHILYYKKNKEKINTQKREYMVGYTIRNKEKIKSYRYVYDRLPIIKEKSKERWNLSSKSINFKRRLNNIINEIEGEINIKKCFNLGYV